MLTFTNKFQSFFSPFLIAFVIVAIASVAVYISRRKKWKMFWAIFAVSILEVIINNLCCWHRSQCAIEKHIVFFDGNSCLIILQHWNANAVDALIVHLLEYLVKLCFLFFITKIVTLFEHNARIFVKN